MTIQDSYNRFLSPTEWDELSDHEKLKMVLGEKSTPINQEELKRYNSLIYETSGGDLMAVPTSATEGTGMYSSHGYGSPIKIIETAKGRERYNPNSARFKAEQAAAAEKIKEEESKRKQRIDRNKRIYGL